MHINLFKGDNYTGTIVLRFHSMILTKANLLKVQTLFDSITVRLVNSESSDVTAPSDAA